MTSVTGVLLGVAEIKLPLKRLAQNELIAVANLSHKAVQDPESLANDQDEQRKAIGVVDGFYAMDEVDVHLKEGQCEVKRREDIVLKHRAADVIVITPVDAHPERVVYICRNDSFGRAALVLQMMSTDHVAKLMEFFPRAIPEPVVPTAQSPEKDRKASWSREMGKKFVTMFNSLSASSSAKKFSSKFGDKSPTSPVRTDSPVLPKKVDSIDRDSLSDSESDEETESSADDTDSQSAGKYYEEMGLDAKVQESLYDDAVETVSLISSSSTESNAAEIEAEITYFVETDREFVESLQSLEKDRMSLAESDIPQYIRENLTLLFMQVKSLIQLHNELHEEFEKSDFKITPICDAILKHQIDYESYVYFMENIPTVDRIIQTHIDFFREKMPDLPEKLRKPRMRLHYYVLTLESVQKKSTSKREKEKLQRAMEILKIPLKRADSKLFLGAVTGSPLDLSNFGNIIRHSDLQLRKGGDLPRRTYHVLALKTLIILTVSREKSYQYITSFRMDQVSLGKSERGVMINLLVRNGPRGMSVLYMFKAKNINVQQLWINDLKEILSAKTLISTPRNSVIITSDLELKIGNRRSNVRHGYSLDRSPKRLLSQNSTGDKEEGNAEQSHLGRSKSDGSFNRRAVIKKNSMTERHRPVVRQRSGNSVAYESNSSHLKNSNWMPPLRVTSVFPKLDEWFKTADADTETQGDPASYLASLADHEEKYAYSLQEQLGNFLIENFPKPPKCIADHLRNLFAFHDKYFLPAIKESCRLGRPDELAMCFIDFAEEFIGLYSEFLADRSRYDEQMKDMNLQNPYVYPILHFSMYAKSLVRLRKHADDARVVEEALSILQQCLINANGILLTDAVSGAPFNLTDCGPILHDGLVKVRFPGSLMKQELHMVLLETMILLLEPRPPGFQYVESIRMDTVGKGPSPDAFTFQLEVRTDASKTQSYGFRFSSKDMKARWDQEITKLLNKQVELLKERLKKKLGNETVNLKEIEPKDGMNLHYVDIKPLETAL